MKPNCIILHGCPSNEEQFMKPGMRTYDKHWIPWVQRILVLLGMSTEAPLMPEPWEPDYEKFKVAFEKLEVNENTILLGHSCGAAFLVRWLGDMNKKVAKLILVAPWKISRGEDKFRKAFYEYPIDESIKSRVGEIIYFTSDTEEREGKESLKIFHDVLGGEIIELKNRGHYIHEHMGTNEFPELLEKIVHFDNRKALILPVNSRNQILIQDRRGYKKPDWGYFGGEIEANETPLQAVIRETKEELQIDVKPNELAYIGSSVVLWGEHTNLRYLFLYRTDQEQFDIAEGKGAHWFSFEEAKDRLETEDGLADIKKQILKNR